MNADAAINSRRTDRMAVLTLVLAVAWLFGIGSLVALYVGRLSLRRMKDDPRLRGRTVAWAGVAVAVFGLALIALWIGMSLTV